MSSSPPHPSPDDVFVVRGGGPLQGRIRVNGAKNSALKLMAAALLAEGETVIENVPTIADVPVMADLLHGLGCSVDIRIVEEPATAAAPSRPSCSVTVRVDEPVPHAPAEHVRRIRASTAILGPLVGRLGHARIAFPGGDDIGARRIDMHLAGLAEMGAEIVEHGEELEVRADTLRGAQITLDFPSVGATENLLMAATLARGRTVIDNAAREPEIQDLCAMLGEMGAHIDGVGTSLLTIDGVESLRPVTHETVPDRIEAGTFAFAAAMTGGDVTIHGARPEHLKLPLTKLAATGATVEEIDEGLRVKATELHAVDVVTLPYPGFPTDLQPQLMVLLTTAIGTGIVTENVFESRFAFVEELQKFGADITIEGHHAVIRGPHPLRGARVRARDVRAGAACLLAGLVAEGETVVTEIHHVDRGYAGIVDRLRAIGADIERRPGA